MYHSQEGQDKFLDTQVFQHFQNGTFVEVGAHNGVTISNTLFFETERNWTGLLIEPLPSAFVDLQKNRPSAILEHCAVAHEEGVVDFLEVKGYSEMTSGIVANYDPRHRRRIEDEFRQYGGSSSVIPVPCKRLSTLLAKHGLTHVHYLSIDVEGSELSVVKSIDFDTCFIDVIGFEANYKDTSPQIVEYLQSNGYQRILADGVDIFMIHRESSFFGNSPS